MSFLDRLLQSRRIVTKVLLFVVPLILLIAGVGLAGFYTARMLNGHMTVTRATIENIGDFERLQASLLGFLAQPSSASLKALNDALAEQEKGISVLEGLVITPEDRQRLSVVQQTAPALKQSTAGLWEIERKTTRTEQTMEASVDEIRALAGAVSAQFETVRKEGESKEKFAKGALFDAYALRTTAARMDSLFDAVKNITNDEALPRAAVTYILPAGWRD